MVTTEPPQAPEQDIGVEIPPVLPVVVVEPVVPLMVVPPPFKLPGPLPLQALKPSAIQQPTMRGSVPKPYLRRNEVSMEKSSRKERCATDRTFRPAFLQTVWRHRHGCLRMQTPSLSSKFTCVLQCR
jgi:hypothetical protein